MIDKALLKGIPKSPGVYLMKDARGRIVYVGQAKNLSNRLHQWFMQKPPTVWGELMLEKVVTFDYLLTDNESEAPAAG